MVKSLDQLKAELDHLITLNGKEKSDEMQKFKTDLVEHNQHTSRPIIIQKPVKKTSNRKITPKYYSIDKHSRIPKSLSKDGVDFYLGGKYNPLETSIMKIWEVSSEYTADQARLLIRRNDPKAKVLFDRSTPEKKIETPIGRLKTIAKKYEPGYYFVQVFDQAGHEYNYNHGELRRKLSAAGESIETYHLDKLTKPICQVYERGSSNGKIVGKGKMIYTEKLY